MKSHVVNISGFTGHICSPSHTFFVFCFTTLQMSKNSQLWAIETQALVYHRWQPPGQPVIPASWYSYSQVQSLPFCIKVYQVTSRIWQEWRMVYQFWLWVVCLLASLGFSAVGETGCRVVMGGPLVRSWGFLLAAQGWAWKHFSSPSQASGGTALARDPESEPPVFR